MRAPGTETRTVLWTAVRPVLARSLPLLAGLVLLIASAVLIELMPAMILRRVVDGQLKVGLVRDLWALGALYLLAVVGARAVAFGQAYLTAVLGQKVLLGLRLDVARHLERLPLGYFDRTPIGEIMSRGTVDVEAVNTLFTTGVIGLLTDLFRIVGVMAAMFALHARLAWLTMIAVPVICWLAEYFRRGIRGAQRGMRAAVARANSHLEETWTGARLIHIYGQEERFQAGLRAVQGAYHRAADRAAAFNASFPGAMEILRALTLAGVVWAGAGLSGLGPPAGVTVGDLAAFVLLISRLFSPLQELSQEYQTIQEALAGLERIAELLAEPPEDRRPAAELPAEGVRAQVEDEPPARVRRGRLVMEGLTFGYRPGLPVLKEITLIVEPGERVAVVGRTGAGKTSLIHLLGGIYRPWQGRLEIDGRQPIGVPPLERRRLLGVVPQTVQLFSGSVWDNLTLGDSSLDPARAEEALRAVGAEGVIAALPDGLATRLGPGGTNLSYGQTQMLCLARALVSNPPLLLLDEPTSGVDTDTEATLYRALREAGRDRTVILVSHRLTGLEDMDRVVILADGRVVQDGPPSALAGERGWYRVLRELESSNWRAGQS